MNNGIGSIFARLELNIQNFRQNLAAARTQAEQAATEMKKSMDLGGAFEKVGGAMTKGITLPLVGIATAAMKVGNDFEYQMSRVKAISGATSGEIAKLDKQAIKLGADTSFSALEVAAGMENLASAGFTAGEIFVAMPGLLDLAAVSGGDVGKASEVAATALRGFGLEADQAAHVADVFARAAADTNAEALDMGEAMKYVAPVAHAMGLSIEETAAAIGIMSDAGIKGSQAGTTLRGALSRLSKPTKNMRGSMEDLGISFFDAEGKMKPLEEQMGMLKEATSGLTQEEKNRHLVTLYGQESLSGMLALIDAGPEKLGELTKSLENSDGAAKEMADTMMDNTKMSIEEMMGSLESAAIMIQKVMAPAVKKMADKVAELIGKFVDADEETQRMIVVFGAILAAIGPVLVIVGKLIKAFAIIKNAFIAFKGSAIALTGPIGLVVAAIAALIGGFMYLYKTNETFRKAMDEAWVKIKDAVSKAWEKIKPSMEEMGKAFMAIIYTLEPLWKWIGIVLGGLVAVFVGIANGILQAIKPAMDLVTNLFDFIANIIAAFLALMKGDFKGAFAYLRRAFENWIDGIKNQIEIVKAFFGGFADGFVGAIKTMMEMVGIDSEKVIADLKVNWQLFKMWIGDIVEKIKDFFITMWDDIKVNWQLFKMWVGDLVSGIADYFIGMWEDVKVNWQLFKMWIGEFVEGIVNFFVGMWESIVSAWETSIQFIVDMWTRFSEGFKIWLEGLMTTYSDTIQSVKDIFTTVGEFFTGAWEVIKNIFAGALLIIADVIAGDFDKIGSDIANIWENISAGLDLMWGAIGKLAEQIFGLIKTFLRETWDAIWNTIVEVWTNISTWLSELWAGMVSSVTQFFIDMYNGIMERVVKTKTDVVDWWGQLKRDVVNLAIKLVADVKQGFEDMKKRVNEIATQLVEWVTKKFREMQQWLAELPGKLYKIGSDMFTSMRNGVDSTITGVYNAIVGGINQAIRWITNLPGEAYNWGKHMIEGMIKGIQDSVKWVQEAASNVAESIRSFLHFTRPDEGPLRMYEEWMPHMLQGLGKTMKSATPKLIGQIKDLSGEMANALQPEGTFTVATGLQGTMRSDSLSRSLIPELRTPVELPGSQSEKDERPNVYIDTIVVRDDQDIEAITRGTYDRNKIVSDSIGNTQR